MRPCSVYANPTCPASDAGDVLALLRGHRVGLRLVMILLSQQRWTPTAIAELLGCDAATVRRWIHRYSTHGPSGLADQPRRGRLRLGSPRLGARIRRLLDHPRAWTIGRLWLALGQPAISLRTLRGGSARLRRGADPAWSPPATPTATRPWPRCAKPSATCLRARSCWPRTRPTSTCFPGCGRPGSPAAAARRS